MELVVNRSPSSEKATIGSLIVDGEYLCFTLEDVVREVPNIPVAQWKVQNETAIPAGTYTVIIDFSNRFQRLMPHIIGVDGFSGVRIHYGNTDADTDGCVLVGNTNPNPDFIGDSRSAFAVLFAKLVTANSSGEKITITLKEAV